MECLDTDPMQTTLIGERWTRPLRDAGHGRAGGGADPDEGHPRYRGAWVTEHPGPRLMPLCRVVIAGD
jgi:hypothetical protein